MKIFFILAVMAIQCFTLGCSIQEASLATESSIVEIKYEQPEGDSPVVIRTTIAGTGERVTVNDYGFADETGKTLIRTTKIQNTYVVGRSVNHNVGYGVVDIKEAGETYSVTSLVGTTSTTAIVSTTGITPPVLNRKTPGKVLIVAFEQDWSFGEVIDVKIVGEESYFNPANGTRQLYNDGTNGDLIANDDVWSLEATIGGTQYGYGFVVNGHTDSVYRDPHEEHSQIYVDSQGFEVHRSVIAIGQ